MNNALIQLLVLAGVAVFLIIKLRSVLGTREGFEKPPLPVEPDAVKPVLRDMDPPDNAADMDITDHVPDGSPAAKALAAMKLAEPSFSVNTFLQGARGAYEMILMAYERGDIDTVRPFLAPEVQDSFAEALAQRAAQGLTIEANFVGLAEMTLQDATFDRNTREAEVTVRFGGELTSVVRNANGEIIEGSPTSVKRQRDVWTFGRRMGAADPNWQLVATGE
ncbi:Predicted lipid-binding transport protein, Tim44 family [Gemmobacter aquatilis]|uniref:Predicted lipid-binding transport protein, Tim44 family n=1 Tax=Gemmobacter aquatilis TaxID=933059 RepID=A0A1H7YWK2_9RHOB|nr:Tim44/TimA family putative adaptor protein [Gemmobacter aquatilis]SEM49667.1 Predicted lipid-binding transport protein, Tim44 family [Gemmobacter aquatilis]